MSFCVSICAEPINAVSKPTANTTCSTSDACTNNGAKRLSKKPPALTMPACISADTGVGPSIVYGSQECSGNCAERANAASATSIAAVLAANPDVQVGGDACEQLG